MPSRDADEFAFIDAAAYFSKDDWTLLQEWQKELYRNVMKEIHQALISLGPLIATTVCSIRAKEKEEQYCRNNQDSRRRKDAIHSASDVQINREVLFTINKDERQSVKNPQYTEERKKENCMNKELSFSNAEMYLTKKETLPNYIGHLDAEVMEDTGKTNPEQEVVPFCVKDEEEIYYIDEEDSWRGEDIDCSADDPLLTSVLPQSLNYKEETHFQKMFESGSRASGWGYRNSKRHTGDSLQRIETTTVVKDLLIKPKAKANIPKSSQTGKKYKNNLWTQGNLEFGERNSMPCEPSFSNTNNSNIDQGTPEENLILTFEDSASSLWDAKLLLGQLQPEKYSRPFACTECEKSFKLKHHLITHMVTHTGERPFHCTECGKSFALKHHLLSHKTTHSGERPYRCVECGKSFSQKKLLVSHQRIHMRLGMECSSGGANMLLYCGARYSESL